MLTADSETARKALEGHRAIFQAIARRQERRAERLMEEHVRIALQRVSPILARATAGSLVSPVLPSAESAGSPELVTVSDT